MGRIDAGDVLDDTMEITRLGVMVLIVAFGLEGDEKRLTDELFEFDFGVLGEEIEGEIERLAEGFFTAHALQQEGVVVKGGGDLEGAVVLGEGELGEVHV